MSHVRALCIALLCFAPGILLVGCGTTISIPAAPQQPLNTLTGNWLLVGTLPDAGPIFPLPPPQSFGLAVSIDEEAGILTANQSSLFTCVNIGDGGSGQLPQSQLAPDGTFTLQTQSLGGLAPTVAFTVMGTAPQTVGGTWSGTYSATNSNAGCNPLSGTFTAVPIQPVTGTFAGATTLGTARTPITITAVLQQGSPGFVTTRNYVNSENVLSGTIKVDGTTCFTTGTMALGQGEVDGGSVHADFAMDDGSRLTVEAAIDDVTVSKLRLASALVVGGQCDKLFTNAPVDLVRQ